MKFGNYSLGIGILGILFAGSLGIIQTLWAQTADSARVPSTPQTLTPAAPPTDDPGSTTAKPAPPAKTQKDDRIFFAIPNILTVEDTTSLPPLTTRQKFKAVAEGTFDPVEIVFVGAQAGIGQADNTNPTYGQGFVGYSKRYGTA